MENYSTEKLNPKQLKVAYLIMIGNCLFISFIFEFLLNEFDIIASKKEFTTFHFLQYLLFFTAVFFSFWKIGVNPVYHFVLVIGLFFAFPIIYFFSEIYISDVVPDIIPRNYICMSAENFYQGADIYFLSIPEKGYILEKNSNNLNQEIINYNLKQRSINNSNFSKFEYIFYQTAILHGFSSEKLIEFENGDMNKIQMALKAPALALIETIIDSFRFFWLLIILNLFYSSTKKFKTVFWVSLKGNDLFPLRKNSMNWFSTLK